jgi:hypothetical protein
MPDGLAEQSGCFRFEGKPAKFSRVIRLKYLETFGWHHLKIFRTLYVSSQRMALTPSSQAPSSDGNIDSGVGSPVNNGRGGKPILEALNCC